MYKEINSFCKDNNVSLVAVSKTKPLSAIEDIYKMGQRVFGENRVPEMVEKQMALPKDIEWHMIGHLQKNKVKYIASFVEMIHSVDSIGLLETINKKAEEHHRKIKVLLQLKIAEETTKYGFEESDLLDFITSGLTKELNNVEICGLMGMASFVNNETQLRSEFKKLKSAFDNIKDHDQFDSNSFDIISMGMSGDYKIAVDEGSNMIRVGSLIFGSR